MPATTRAADVACAVGELCVKMAEPDYGIFWFECRPNPCGADPVTCACAESVCPGYSCEASDTELVCTYDAACVD